MVGIQRINIDSAWSRSGDWRVRMSADLQPTADVLYRQIFHDLGMDLLDGVEAVECGMKEALSRYDWQEGIDVILFFRDGTKATLQEKFLTFGHSTCTFEEKKTSGKQGAWYYCTAQYYFVGYARKYLTQERLLFQDWILVDLPAIHRQDARGELSWYTNKNDRDGRGAEFRYLYFKTLVKEPCTVAYMNQPRVEHDLFSWATDLEGR